MAKGQDTARVKEWLLKNGTITQGEAYHGFGNMRLSAVIHKLRHQEHWDIETEMVHTIDDHGEPMHYGRYILKSAPIERRN